LGVTELKHDSVTKESQETAALYALGGLSQHEARAFELHLKEGCDVCQVEFEQFTRLVSALGEAAAPVSPPGYLRDLLVARIEREASAAPAVSSSPAAFPEKPASFHPSPLPARSLFRRDLLPWAVAAALLLALAYSFTTWRLERRSLQSTLDQERAQTSEARGQNSRLKAELNEQAEEFSTELAQINSVLSSSRWRMISLAGQEPAPDASARIYWDVKGERWVVTADLPPAPEGKVYQLWFVTPEAKISAGLINPNTSGHGFVVVRFPSSIARIAAAAITLEPEGGSQQPTMPIYALGRIS
jgi:anti-sigma-K factor RskA